MIFSSFFHENITMRLKYHHSPLLNTQPISLISCSFIHLIKPWSGVPLLKNFHILSWSVNLRLLVCSLLNPSTMPLQFSLRVHFDQRTKMITHPSWRTYHLKHNLDSAPDMSAELCCMVITLFTPCLLSLSFCFRQQVSSPLTHPILMLYIA